MDLTVDQFLDGLFTEQSHEQPSDKAPPDQIEMTLPKDFDEKLFNQGRRFFWHHSFAMTSSMLTGLIGVFAVPSILKILVSTRKSNSVFTAYRRYLSTLLHTLSWFENELKPGSRSWKSLYAVRTRHARATMAARVKGLGVVSQRDVALTQFGFIGAVLLKPDKFGVRQLQDGDWDAYVYVWRVIGHLIGLEDRYNICRKSAEETRQVCQALQDRVYTPCLENVPEYFEHAARVTLEGMTLINPTVDVDGLIYWCRYILDVPGYVYTEGDRQRFVARLREQLKGKPPGTGVDSTALIEKSVLKGLPDLPPRLHYLKDYEKLESVPTYKQLPFKAKYKLACNNVISHIYSVYVGRIYFNLHFLFSVLLMKYLPYLAFFKFGVIKSYVNIFREDPVDDEPLKKNSEYYNVKREEETWYRKALAIIW